MFVQLYFKIRVVFFLFNSDGGGGGGAGVNFDHF